MGEYRISGDIIIYFSLNKPYLINTKTHEEFEINDSELISEISRFSISGEVNDAIKEVLVENGILIPKDRDEPLSKFRNDFLDLFHKGSNDVLNELNTLSPIEYALTYLESCTLIEGHKPPERKKQNRQGILSL